MQQPVIYLTMGDLFATLVVIAAVALGAAWWRRRTGREDGDAAPLRRAHRAGARVVALFDDYAQLAGRIAAIHAVIKRQGEFMPPELRAQLTAEVAAAYARLKKIHDGANEEVQALMREGPGQPEMPDLQWFVDTLRRGR